MKKLFISVPMKGRLRTAIGQSRARMHKAAEALLGEELEVIDSWLIGKPPKSNKVATYCLGTAIQSMADADYFVGVDKAWSFRGCMIERQVADLYGIPVIELPLKFVAPDADRELSESHVGTIPVE